MNIFVIVVLLLLSAGQVYSAEREMKNPDWSDHCPYQKMSDGNHVPSAHLAAALAPSLESMFRQDKQDVAALTQQHERALNRKKDCMHVAFTACATLVLAASCFGVVYGNIFASDLKNCH